MKSETDEQLVANYLKGNEKALEILIKRYLKPIYNFVYRYIGSEEAEDVTQEVFLKIWRNLKKFKQNKKFKTWIFSIAKNTAIDFLKKKKIIPFSEFEKESKENTLIETVPDSFSLPNEFLEKAELAEEINSVLEKLPLSYRMVLFLYYTEHFNFREIAEILGESINTVKSRHRRALLMLKKMLEDKNYSGS